MTKLNFSALKPALIAGLVTATLGCGVATAQDANRAEMLERADANGDGAIAWEEVTALRLETFNRVDRNGDGVVNKDDSPPRALSGRFNEALARLQADFDGDRDGQITQDEMLNAPAPMFEAGDTNADGIVSADELTAARAAMPSR